LPAGEGPPPPELGALGGPRGGPVADPRVARGEPVGLVVVRRLSRPAPCRRLEAGSVPGSEKTREAIMGPSTRQMNAGAGPVGQSYTERNDQTVEEMDQLYLSRYGMTRTDMNAESLGELDRSLRILEVGTNIGTQLLCLQRMGFENLYGVELQWYAVEKAKG